MKFLPLATLAFVAVTGCAGPTANLVAKTASGSTAADATDPSATKPSTAGPIRLVRVEYVTGNVLWRPGDTAAWSAATVNMPIRQGAQVWADGGKGELQFDDGSVFRLGAGAVCTLSSLYSDKDGEFTELKLNSGTATCHLKNKFSIYQVDTPYEAVKATGPAELRFDVAKKVDVTDIGGNATVSCSTGSATLKPGDSIDRDTEEAPLTVSRAPAPDSWDHFDNERDAVYSDPVEHVPTDVGLVSAGMEGNGTWDNDPHDGWLWSPRVASNWRPYNNGNWVWVDPVGWTWVSNEPWGWAPYHYGSWRHRNRGWSWSPGPYNQYWSPGVVDFTSYDGNYGWTPLSPDEVRYPASIGIGFDHGNWWADFSIGGCAAYLPGDDGYCSPYVFSLSLFSGSGYGGNWDNRWNSSWDGYRSNYRFIPRNSAFGATYVSAGQFGQSGRFTASNANSTNMWQRGTPVVAANRAFSGPVTARPNRNSFTPTHTFASNASPAALNRGVFSAPNRAQLNPSTRTGNTVRATTSSVPAGVARARQSVGFVGRTGTNFGTKGTTATRTTARVQGANTNAARTRASTQSNSRVAAQNNAHAAQGIRRTSGAAANTTRRTGSTTRTTQGHATTGRTRQSSGPTRTNRTTGATHQTTRSNGRTHQTTRSTGATHQTTRSNGGSHQTTRSTGPTHQTTRSNGGGNLGARSNGGGAQRGGNQGGRTNGGGGAQRGGGNTGKQGGGGGGGKKRPPTF